ncbi:glycosyltransferase family 4 protein [Vibrio sp. 10N.239.312.D08]|uniref:glycosyltransferase family 4 protein n=1 Tax=Vibrio sp. 10N.239.312.D08 TaxID=3229978 RepID=UPI0035544B49
MKILQVVPGLSVGGVENVAISLANELCKKHDVTVLSQQDAAYDNNSKKLSSTIPVYNLQRFSKMLFLFDMFRVWNFLRGKEFEIIHAHGISYFYLFVFIFLSKTKVIYTIHNEPKRETQGVRKLFNMLSFRRSNVSTVVLGDSLIDEFKKYYNLEPNYSIMNGVVRPNNKLEVKHNISQSDVNLIAVGRLDQQKNFPRLIQSFKSVYQTCKNISLTIYCVADENSAVVDDLRKMVEGYPIYICLNDSNVINYYHCFDAFVLSSDYEGLPLTLLEALSNGLPVVSTNVGCISDVINNNSLGYVCDKNAASLARGILGLINNIDKFDSLLIEDIFDKCFSINIMSEHYVKVYYESVK